MHYALLHVVVVQRDSLSDLFVSHPRASAGAKFARHAELLLGEPDAQDDHIPHDEEHDDACNQDSNNVAGYFSRRILGEIKETVNVETLGVGCEIGQTQVHGQDDDEGDQVPKGHGLGAREYDLEQGVEGIEGMLRHVGPDGEGRGEAAGGKEGPVHGYA